MSSMSFLINDQSTSTSGAPAVKVTVTENGDGTLTFKIEQVVAAGNYLGDLRGFFFDIANESLLSSLRVSEATRYLANGSAPLIPIVDGTNKLSLGDDSVSWAGTSSNNMNGLLGSDRGYDAGLEIGTEGIGAGGDDVQAYSFVLSSSSNKLSLADFANVNFGVRIMSVGQDTNGDSIIDTSRSGSSKLLENSGVVAIADFDSVTEGGPVTADGNVLTGIGGSDANKSDGGADLGATGSIVIGVAYGALPSALGNVGSAVAGTYGTIKVASNGAYTYALDNAAVEFLAAGETRTETFTYTVKSADGDLSSTTVTVTITGTNDAAVIGNPTVASVTEDVAVTNGNLVASGSISISDVDQNQSSFRTTVGSANGNLGTLTLAADGTYTYSVANSATQYLGAGETKVDTFTVTALDGTTKQVSFTINGANDGPPTPVASNDVLWISSGTNPSTFSLSSLLANDTANASTFAITSGAATYDAATQMITVTSANAGTFTYTLTNGSGKSNATVTVKVVAVQGGAETVNLSAEAYAASFIDHRGGGDTFLGSTVITGSTGDDRVFGAAGNDELDAKGGNNVLTGGDGADDFILTKWFGMSNHITDFEAGTNTTSIDQIKLDVGTGTNEFSVGNNDSVVDGLKIGSTLVTTNVAGSELIINNGNTFANDAAVQAYIDSHSNITGGSVFIVFNSELKHAGVYYDADPHTAGGAVLIAELDSLTSPQSLSNLNSGDFLFF